MGTVSDGTSMKCDVVNGGYDQKAYLLVPPQNEMLVKKELEDYKTKVFPFAQGEARFCETIGLPPVIHISTKVKQCLEVFDRLTPAQVWQRAPDSVRQATSSQLTTAPFHPPSCKSDFEERIANNNEKAKQTSTLLRNRIMEIKIDQLMAPCIQHQRNQDSRLRWIQHSKHGSRS